MKAYVCVLLLAAVALAEPPRYRQTKYRFARGELEESGSGKEDKAKTEEAPYPAAGFKPSKEFKLPSRQEVAPPSTSYGVPDDSYQAPFRIQTQPEVEYGVPRNTEAMVKRAEEKEGSEEESKEGEKSEKPEKSEEGESEEKSEVEDLKGEEKKKGGEEEKKGEGEKKEKTEEEPKDDVVSEQGAYYVLLPGSQLQRVQYNTQNDLTKMAYTAQLQYKDEDRAPLYIYTAVPEYTVPLAQYQFPTSAAYFQLY
ncbi:neurofilament heavy polypeptide-like [Galleria mellonella]|uniref:Neurofilament heavy polypeptide-like n=1 Tax=Galleria mellonella TaxID=7137 RepID=A0A6J3C6L8_GALME|nr:neurofilament heavy polypeptide-like [Galleria mellonella]